MIPVYPEYVPGRWITKPETPDHTQSQIRTALQLIVDMYYNPQPGLAEWGKMWHQAHENAREILGNPPE